MKKITKKIIRRRVLEKISVKSQNKYIISNQWNNSEKELNMQSNVKMKNGKNLKVKALVNLEYIYTEINKQLIMDKRI